MHEGCKAAVHEALANIVLFGYCPETRAPRLRKWLRSPPASISAVCGRDRLTERHTDPQNAIEGHRRLQRDKAYWRCRESHETHVISTSSASGVRPCRSYA